MSKVIAFKDTTPQGEPCADVVAKLEELLESAKSGELRGLAFAASLSNSTVRSAWVHAEGEGHRLSTGIMVLNREWAAAWDDVS